MFVTSNTFGPPEKYSPLPSASSDKSPVHCNLIDLASRWQLAIDPDYFQSILLKICSRKNQLIDVALADKRTLTLSTDRLALRKSSWWRMAAGPMSTLRWESHRPCLCPSPESHWTLLSPVGCFQVFQSRMAPAGRHSKLVNDISWTKSISTRE